jgi:N6-L-threonylcarbamoyladenine synthase
MNILAIETSCDETSFAVVTVREGKIPHFSVVKNIVSSQVELHAQYGGVVPNLAKREHLKNLPILWEEIRKVPLVRDKKIDLLTVTVGPGLEPALWTGISFAEKIHEEYFEKKIPLVGANHLEGHVYSFLLSPSAEKDAAAIFPAISLLVSGGHTILACMQDPLSYRKLGETLDDAVGESFDKVARLLNLPYPGGPRIEQLAKEGNPDAIQFPSPMMHQKNYNFSYSGLKTSVLYYLKSLGSTANDFSLSEKDSQKLASIEQEGTMQADLAASFQNAAFRVLVAKAVRAARENGAKSIFIGGGVAANKALARMLRAGLKKEGVAARIIIPPFKYCQDNAAMVAAAGYFAQLRKKRYPIKAQGTLSL